VTQREFVDHYEVLQLSQNADGETLDRVYRMLAKRFHPDNAKSGDAERFREVDDAFRVLSNPEKRAAYDAQYEHLRGVQWNLYEQGAAIGVQEEDRRIFHGVLSLLYVARRRDPEAGGLGIVPLERMLGVPVEHLRFPIWYLRRRDWIEVLNNGQYAITIDGIDTIASKRLSLPDSRLIPETSETDPAWGGSDREADIRPEALEMPHPSGHAPEASA